MREICQHWILLLRKIISPSLTYIDQTRIQIYFMNMLETHFWDMTMNTLYFVGTLISRLILQYIINNFCILTTQMQGTTF